LDTVELEALATGLRCAAVFGLGLAGAFVATAAGSGATGSSSAGAVPATPMVLDSVRWHVSQVMIVRTRVPS
jgi:hypothetical protein